jgi:hypothetical protein
MQEQPTIVSVKGPRDDQTVALWDVHPDHPESDQYPDGGEIFVINDGVVWEAALTPAVSGALRDGTLVEAKGGEHPAAKAAAVTDPGPGGPGGPSASPAKK